MDKVLITGGATGIGAGCVRAFARNNYTVLLHYNSSSDQAEELQRQLTAEGYDVHIYQADLTDSSSIKAMCDKILRLHKRVDVLINNAGVALYSQFQDITDSQLSQLMSVNCMGTFTLTQHIARAMLSRGSGAITFVSSIWGMLGASCESAYCMSKHAIVGLSKALHEELSQSGINVNCVCPAVVKTAMTAHLSEEDITSFNEQYQTETLTADEAGEKILSVTTSGTSGQVVRI